MKLEKIEAWTTDGWTGKRYKFAEAVTTPQETYKSMQMYYDVSGELVAAHPQRSLTVEDAMEIWLESDYEILIKSIILDDGRRIYQHYRTYGEPEASKQLSGIDNYPWK